tara:strand:- start:4953 stop:5813 length:861 start_codon:yes stop_codon:yes gene_type:complete
MNACYPTGSYDSTELSDSEYRQLPYINASLIKQAIASTKYLEAYLSKDSDESPALVLGSAFHMTMLEPHLFDETFVLGPKVDRRTKVGKAAWAEFIEHHGNKKVLTGADMLRIEGMKQAIASHDEATDLLYPKHQAAYEKVMIYNPDEALTTDGLTTSAMKGKLDVVDFGRGFVVDIKTTQDASPDSVGRTIERFGYDIQAAFYSNLYREVVGENPTFWFVFVEKEPPHGVLVCRLDDDWLEYGAARMKRGINAVDDYRMFGTRDYNNSKGLVLECPAYISARKKG